MKLTAVDVASAKPRDKPYKLTDGEGLYLLVKPSGSKLWRVKYYFGRKEKLMPDGMLGGLAPVEKSLSLGCYPRVSLKDARRMLIRAREMIEAGEDPSAAKKARVVAQTRERATFGTVGQEYLGQAGLKPVTLEKAVWLLKQLKPLHERSVAALTTPELHEALKRIEADGRHETAHRANMLAGRILRYAIVTGRRTERDISAEIRGSLKPVETESHAALTDPQAFGALLRASDAYTGHTVVRHALKLTPLVFVRPGELRQARWSEFDFTKREWRIPGERMKMKRPHLVPLARQAVDILVALQLEGLDDELVFPSVRPGRPMSENAINTALRSMFYSGDEHTAHGYRSTASTLLNELGFDPAVIEMQLAHVKKDKIAGIYDRSQRVEDRRAMMQAWADYLDELRAGAKAKAA